MKVEGSKAHERSYRMGKRRINGGKEGRVSDRKEGTGTNDKAKYRKMKKK